MDKINAKCLSLAAGFTGSIVYLVCLSWGLFLTLPALKMVHIQILEIAFPGFAWISFGSFIWGLVLSFLYGFLGMRIFILIYRLCSTSDEEIDLGKKDIK